MVSNLPTHRNSRPEVFCKKCFLRKNLENVFLKRAPAQVFSCEFREIFKNTFLSNTSSGCFYTQAIIILMLNLGKVKKSNKDSKCVLLRNRLMHSFSFAGLAVIHDRVRSVELGFLQLFLRLISRHS